MTGSHSIEVTAKPRIAGNTVIDHENVTVDKDKPSFKAIAIYKIKDGKIAEVYFIP